MATGLSKKEKEFDNFQSSFKKEMSDSIGGRLFRLYEGGISESELIHLVTGELVVACRRVKAIKALKD